MAFNDSHSGSSTSRSSPPICSEPIDLALKSHFGFPHLRRYQKEAIENILHGRDCLVVMATGAGKSMCYQLPPLVAKKTAIVVSPLLSLMQDQVMSLNKRGINADFLGSTQTKKSVMTSAQNGLYDVLFLTPEKAMSLKEEFWEKIKCHGVCLFAVDEAHCISEWGPDFRQDYKLLHELRGKLPGVPFVALTATATDRVRDDITQSLKLNNPFVAIGSFDRPNIFYSVKLMIGPPSVNTFFDLISSDVQRRFQRRESTIIYCLTIQSTQDIHDALTAIGVSCGIYHGQMNRHSREKSHKSFVSGEILVMVATIAFGMGIDKPDVRCVIHYGCPKSLESYYQESGRCGRDGLPSYAYLYYSRADFTRGDYYCSDVTSEKQKAAIMNSFLASQKYCMIGTCRRRELLKYFGEESRSNCGNCDNCMNSKPILQDLFEESVLLLTSIRDCHGRWGLNMPINVLRGSKGQKIVEKGFHLLSVHGKGKTRSVHWWKCLASILSSHGFLVHSSAGTFGIVRLTEKGEKLILDSAGSHRELIFTLPQEMIDEENEVINQENVAVNVDVASEHFTTDDTTHTDCMDSLSHPSFSKQPESNDEFQMYQMLLRVRVKLAEENAVPPHAICSDEVLSSIARIRPSNMGSMALVEGLNYAFLNLHSVIFLHHVKEMCEEKKLSVDNIEDLLFTPDTEDSVAECADQAMSYEEILEKIRITVSSSSGVTAEEIVESFPNALKDTVLNGIEDLEKSYEIFCKQGFFLFRSNLVRC